MWQSRYYILLYAYYHRGVRSFFIALFSFRNHDSTCLDACAAVNLPALRICRGDSRFLTTPIDFMGKARIPPIDSPTTTTKRKKQGAVVLKTFWP